MIISIVKNEYSTAYFLPGLGMDDILKIQYSFHAVKIKPNTGRMNI